MLNVFSSEFYIIILLGIVKYVHCQYLDDACVLKSTGSPGTCKLLNDCPSALEELQKNQRFPQRCGFQGNTPIVCCPNIENTPPSNRKPGEISYKKCREYAAYVYDKRPSPTLLIGADQVTRYECGHKVEKLIVGGNPAERKEFPHMAAVGYETDEGVKWLCGGTIISNQYILTAAHCLSHLSWGDAKVVKLGVTDLTDVTNRQEIKIAQVLAYPEYRSSSTYHDIGLLKLEQRINLNPFARPACLYSKSQIDAERSIATGWGQTTWAGSGSDRLLKVKIDLFDYNSCNSSYKNEAGSRRLKKGIIDEIQLCAGSLNEEKDTCQGDSGGPLQIYHIGDKIKCMYDIIGITSFGKACSGNPGVYVRVSHYIKWIEDIVWPEVV